ncbi:MAG: TadE family protein [Sulfuriferula sp.]
MKPIAPLYHPGPSGHQTGAGAVEFAIALPAWMMLILYQARLQLELAAQEAMRAGTVLRRGIGTKPDYVRARWCAYLDRSGLSNGDGLGHAGFDGLSILMIYANGLGVPRNLALATKFTCEAGCAQVELEGQLEHLQGLAAGAKPEGNAYPWNSGLFDVCDDVTSGEMGGNCTSLESERLGARRHARIWAVPCRASLASNRRDAASPHPW